MTSRKPDRFHYTEFARGMSVSSSTLRRRLRTLKRAGLVTTEFVPRTNNTEAFFQIHLAVDPRTRRTPQGRLARPPRSTRPREQSQ